MDEKRGYKNRGLLNNQTFRKVFIVYMLTTFGDWFDALAIQVVVGYRWGVSPLMLALIPIAIALPGVLLSSVAGVVADRLSQVKIMRVCNLLTAVLSLTIFLAPNMIWLLCFIAVRAAVSTIYVPAQQALTRVIVRENQILKATSFNGLVNQGSKIAGPLLGGFALLLFSPEWCILFNACVRFVCFLMLFLVKDKQVNETNAHIETRTRAEAEQEVYSQLDPQVNPQAYPEVQLSDHSDALVEPKSSFRLMWREGWTFIFGNKLLRNTLLFGFIGTITIQMIDYQFTSLFRTIAPSQESFLGWMIAASGLGAIGSILMMNKMNKMNTALNYGWRLGTGYILIGISIVGLGMLNVGQSLLFILLLGLVLGIGNGIFFITFSYCLQKETHSKMIGRVFGIQSTLLSMVMLLAPLLGGVLVQLKGAQDIFVALGLLILCIGLLGVVFNTMIWPHHLQREHSNENNQVKEYST
ncbi:MFS family permease [Paenibacillus turicensis]|uniref:MFS family permease n=1 Tax=Paenibacillus turicensis TaxID=160487 RepID=A0ABS4FRA9_9BACL|nr:MFS transporter [Paenibacillus turicensis]MBP1905112.1 MFS family permease [Paenibacillus turicensis]